MSKSQVSNEGLDDIVNIRFLICLQYQGNQRPPSLLNSSITLILLLVFKSCNFPSCSCSIAILSFSPLALPSAEEVQTNILTHHSSYLWPVAHSRANPHTQIIIFSVLPSITAEQACWQTAALRVTAKAVSGQRWIWLDRVACC